MVLTALLILLEDGAPIFTHRERVGRGGKPFRVISSTSMRREKDGKPRWATSNDDRGRVGRFIRRLRIDELPQTFNVLAAT